MPVATIDLDDGLAALLAGDLARINQDISAPATPDPILWGEDVRSFIQAAIPRLTGADPFPDGTIPASAVDRTIYEIDFATLANNTITDGTESIDSLNWTAVNSAELGTFAIQNGTGLRMVAATSNGGATTMTSTSQLIPYIWLPLSSIPNYDPRLDLVVEIYCSSLVHEASSEGVVVGLHGPSASPTGGSVSRMRWAGLVNDGAAARALRVTLTTTATTTDDTRTTHDVVGLRLNATGLGSAWSGVYSSGIPRAVSVGPVFGTASATENPFNSNGTRLFIGLVCANDASPTTAATVRLLRIRQ